MTCKLQSCDLSIFGVTSAKLRALSAKYLEGISEEADNAELTGYARELYVRERLGRKSLLNQLLNRSIPKAFSELSRRAIISGFEQSTANCFPHLKNGFYTETGDIIRTNHLEHHTIAKAIDTAKSWPQFFEVRKFRQFMLVFPCSSTPHTYTTCIGLLIQF